MPRVTAPPAPDWSWLAAWPDHFCAPGGVHEGFASVSPVPGFYRVMYDLAIVVYGRPAPQGSKSAKGRRKNGSTILVESSPHLPSWREAVRSEAAAKLAAVREIGPLPTVPIAGPVAARMVFTMPCPARARPGDRPAVEPDLDKLVRGTCDALADAGVIANDKLIVEFDRVAKVYPCWDPESLDRPGAVIRLRRLT
jgi:Holliday junction resolvase RusA-like endonuclease